MITNTRVEQTTRLTQPTLALSQLSSDQLCVTLSGDWLLRAAIPSEEIIESFCHAHAGVKTIHFNTSQLKAWDSGLLTFLLRLHQCVEQAGLMVDWGELPTSVQNLLALALEHPKKKQVIPEKLAISKLALFGVRVITTTQNIIATVRFLGELTMSLGKFVIRRARFLPSDLAVFIQASGFQALGIVSLIGFLVGLILAFIGAVQFQQFGATIYVANLVAIGMTREMAPIMTAIVMAGRTGAAYAAQLGSMQVNEEIDALRTLAIPPIDFLVLPRMLALVLMMPLLCLYADLMGMLGGAVVGIGMYGFTPLSYLTQSQSAITMVDFNIGIIKSIVFGILVAFAGCLRGIRCGKSAMEVGQATTSAVVTGIVYIIAADALFSIILDLLKI